MVWRVLLGNENIRISRPGRDAFGPDRDQLLRIGARGGQILEQGYVNLQNISQFERRATYNFSRNYSAAPEVRLLVVEENIGITFPAYTTSNGDTVNAKWTSNTQVFTNRCEIRLNTTTVGGGFNSYNPVAVTVLLFRKRQLG